MFSSLFTNPLEFLLEIIALVVALTIHEFSHAWVADHLGDPTPRLQGRLTLNPLKHLDPVGTLLLLVARFGWGKPVEFDPFNLREPRRDAAIISFAGPLSNLLLALVTGGISWALVTFASLPSLVMTILYLFIYTNISLAVFNLIPIHPLDGFKIVGGLLPRDKAHEWYSLERYGIIFLILLIMPIGRGSMVSMIIRPIVNFLVTLIAGHLVTF
jgi:Zn-dependent protease